MSGTALAALWNLGPAISGQVLGLPYAQFRATGAGSPVAPVNQIGTLPCWITPDQSSKAHRAAAPGKPIWTALFDPARTLPGDYLVGPLGTFWIQSQDVPAPIQVVRCNRVVNFTRVGPPAPGSYGGDLRGPETPLLTGWPVAAIQGTKRSAGTAKLPGDTFMPWFDVFLPVWPGVSIAAADRMYDDLGAAFDVEGAEMTALGWRINVVASNT